MKVLSVVCAILFAGITSAARDVNLDAGEDYAFTVLAFPSTVASCHLTTPAGDTLDFVPYEVTQYGDRYQLLPISTSMPTCSILVKSLQETDNGLWEVSFVSTTGSSNSFRVELTVTGTEIQEETEPDNILWLDSIEHRTRTEQVIDISLPKSHHDEICTVRTPNGGSLNAAHVDIEGVTVFEGSDFVSCRITVGPMVESLLGDWSVCGTYTEGDEEQTRCQHASIVWNNVQRPQLTWSTITQRLFESPVHFGKTLTPTVTGSGDVVTCHVVTPNGEDLVVTQDSVYPHIKVLNTANSACNFAIGPIDGTLLGDWTVYGMFRSPVTGQNEVRLPIHMFLYDEENPYDQAYNVTILDPVERYVNLENTLYVGVSVDAGEVDSCQFETPSGQIFDMHKGENSIGASFITGEDNTIACQVAIGPISVDHLGDWKLIGKFSNNGIFTELRQTYHIIQEDPENPKEEDRDIYYLDSEVIDTKIGGKHKLVISSDAFITGESCHIRTPDGLQYIIMEGFSLEGVEVIKETGVECGVTINVTSENFIGEWTLIARATRFSAAIERRLPFTIYVEESVEALPAEVTILEGNDLYVRLRYPTDEYESCKLIGPYGIECASAERDPLHNETCGFVRKNVQTFHTGTWTIVYGSRITYKAETVLTVSSTSTETESFVTTMDLLRDRKVEKVVGPQDAIYCRLVDPQGVAVFDGFGRCNLTLDKVGLEHNGIWQMNIGVAGKVHTDDYQLQVTVKESEGKAVVTTHVEQQKPVVMFTCSVQTDAEVTACKFRDPQGRILLSTSGVAEDRYAFHGNEVSYESEVRTHECGLRITNPLVTDLGIWRCGIETSENIYYGHLKVLCPWALQDPEVAASVQQVPILKADRAVVSVVEQEPATMSCSVEGIIRYCYFRASNGTVYTVNPDMSSSAMAYVGAGFDAGECGVRFSGLSPADSGRWSCHVGLLHELDEQRDQLQLTVHERMYVDHYYTHGNVMVVRGVVYENRALEYCRFVRIDGFGFTTDNVPAQYTVTGLITNGECQFTARDPTVLDLHPWTIVARIRGQDIEIAKDTMEALMIQPPAPEEPNGQQPGMPNNQGGFQIFFFLFLSALLVSILLGAWLGPKKHREWTYRRASAFRRSLSNSFRRDQKPPTVQQA